MVMAVPVIVAVIMPVVMSATGAVNMRRSTRFRVAMAAVLGMVAMPVILIMSMTAVVMTRARGRAIVPARARRRASGYDGYYY